MERHRLTEREPFTTNTRTLESSGRGTEETNVITGEPLLVRKGHSNPCLSVTWVFLTEDLLNLLKLLQLISSATKNAKSAVTYVTIRASSLEYLLDGYTTFRKTTKKTPNSKPI